MGDGGEGRRSARAPVVRALGLFAAVCAAGTFGFSAIEGWSYWRSLYFTLITVTTVGYGDEGVSEAGRYFAVLVLLGGFGVTTYTFTQLMQYAVSKELTGGRKMVERIRALRGHAIVCGFGRMGEALCRQLARDGCPFVVVEREEESFRRAVAAGYLALRGRAEDDAVLVAAGVDRAAHLISAVDDPAENIAVTLSARDLNPGIEIVARAEREEEVRKLRRAGANHTVAPFRSAGLEAAQVVSRPAVASFLARTSEAESDLVLGEIRIHPDSPLVGAKLAECGRSEGARLSFVALERAGGETRVPPSGSDELAGGDLLIVAGHPEDVAAMRRRGESEPGGAPPPPRG